MPRISFTQITQYLEKLADAHVDVNDKYRWNAGEFTARLRTGVNLPVVLIDAVETQSSGDNTKTIHSHSTAITVLGKDQTYTGKIDSYQKQNEVLEMCQKICFDFETRIIDDASKLVDDQGSKNWLYGHVDKNSFHHFKVGPVFTDGLFGYRCEITIKNQVPTNVEALNWHDL
jgi:hypothetical protein